MDSLLDQLSRQEVWEEFLAHRLMKGRFTWHAFEDADAYVAGEAFRPAAERLIRGESPGIPERKAINKMGSGKKRIVYSFDAEMTPVLKLLAYLLYKYDGAFAPNCYSFRRGLRASDAILQLRSALRGRPMWAYKLDIHDYFNSIPVPSLLPLLRDLLQDDPRLYRFFETMLSEGPGGVLPGTPTAPFLADVYLMDADHFFAREGVLYARYSDDIILFAPDRTTLEARKAELLGFLSRKGLEINPDKERIYPPEEPFDFLGFRCRGEQIGIAAASLEKMKGKIRRAARALRRWQQRKGLSPEQAMKGLVNTFNNKFFGGGDPEELSWSRWFFPVINSTDGLLEIDHYLQQYIRYAGTGRHSRANYRIRYDDLRRIGYRSLVHEFYRYKAASGTILARKDSKPYDDEKALDNPDSDPARDSRRLGPDGLRGQLQK